MIPVCHLPPLVVDTPFSFSPLAIPINPVLLRIMAGFLSYLRHIYLF